MRTAVGRTGYSLFNDDQSEAAAPVGPSIYSEPLAADAGAIYSSADGGGVQPEYAPVQFDGLSDTEYADTAGAGAEAVYGTADGMVGLDEPCGVFLQLGGASSQ